VLTGKKQLPVLVGDDVPCPMGTTGLAESLEICSFIVAQHGINVPCATGRADVDTFIADLRAASDLLCVPRNPKMPVADWADERDVSYFLWKKQKHEQVPQSAAVEAKLKARVNATLGRLPAMLRGHNCLNAWGWGMDDVLLLPWLRRTTMITGIEYPPEVAAYMAATTDELCDYSKHAC